MNATMIGKDASKDLVDPLDGLIGYQLRRASLAILDDLAKDLADLKLRPTSASILLLVGANPGITQSGIGRVLGVERANMAPLATALTKRGLVSRSRADGRSQGLHLTVKGRAMAATARARIAAHESRFFGGCSAAERASLIRILRTVWHD